MESTANCDNYFTQNTDISGIGVRAAFYLQVLLILIDVTLSPDDALDAFWALTAMTVGLVIAAIVSASQDGLSFYNANIVQNLIWMANACLVVVFFSQRSIFKERKAHSVVLSIVFMAEILLSCSLILYLWSTAYGFGLDPECTPTLKIYFMFWRVSISFRIIRILAIVFYTLNTVLALGLASFCTKYLKDMLYKEVIPRSPKRGLHAQPKLTFLVAFLLCLATGLFCIAPIELFLKQHPQAVDTDSQWSFGQIFALIAVAPSIVATWFALTESFSKLGSLDAEGKTTESNLDASLPVASALPAITPDEKEGKVQGTGDEGITVEAMPVVESVSTKEIEETE